MSKAQAKNIEDVNVRQGIVRKIIGDIFSSQAIGNVDITWIENETDKAWINGLEKNVANENAIRGKTEKIAIDTEKAKRDAEKVLKSKQKQQEHNVQKQIGD